MLPKLQSSSLISLRQLCDNNCEVKLNKVELKVYKDEKLLLKSHCNNLDKLCNIPIVGHIKENSFVMPPTNLGIYKNRVNKIN